MLIIGSHVSFRSDSQLVGSINEALSYGANAFMFYTGAPQNTNRCDLDDNKTMEALNIMKENNFNLDNVICHAPYIVNLANNNDLDKYNFQIDFLRREIDRCITLGVKYLVLHPGAATNLDRNYALDNIVNALNKILMKEDNIVILLETMAGKGTELGVNINELKYIIDNVELNEKIGVCLDTCHLNDSGIDLNDFDEYLNTFDSLIGINKIGCVHVNDSKNELGARKDRHENIGYGKIGFEVLLKIVYNHRLENIPKILETPYLDREYAPYKQEITMIKDKKFNSNLYEDILKYYKG